MNDVCKCCGQKLPRLLGVTLSLGYLRIVQIVQAAGEQGIRADRLFDALYDDDPDGGPLTGIDNLHSRIKQLNNHLAKARWKVQGSRSGNGSFGFYRLVRIDGRLRRQDRSRCPVLYAAP